MSFSDIIRNSLHNFSSLFAQRNIIQINLRVCCHKDVEIITEYKREAQDLLGLRKREFDLLSLLLLQEEQVQLAISNLHGHAVFRWMHGESKNMLVYRRQIKSKWNLSTSSIPLEFLPNDEVSFIMENK